MILPATALPRRRRHLAAWLAAFGALAAGCSSEDADTVGGPGGSGAGGAGGGPPSQGFCGDGACVLAEGENRRLCEADCGPPDGSGADVQFFADFDSKAVEYGQTVRFTYVVWNEGPETARNVVLPVPIIQNEDTTIYGDREHCGAPGERYDCMVDLSYVPSSMRVNRVYHPNRARNSYAFVDTIAVTDAVDGDGASYRAADQLLFLTIAELRPRSAEPEDAGLVWSYELAADGGIGQTPCEQHPLIQNWNWIFADNAPEYMNDIIGHVYCESPRLRAAVTAAETSASPGDTLHYSITMSYDDLEPPEGIDIDRFTLFRPRLFLNYPEELLEVTAIDKPEEATDLPAEDETPSAGGVIYWARLDEAGETNLAPGESETLVVTARVRDGVPTGSTIRLDAHVVSQRTRAFQNVDASHEITVTAASAPGCGDGLCTPGNEDATSCAADCPRCTPEDGVTSFESPPCCDGLTLVRGSHPYSWAYDQCYEWEGGGTPFVQGYCTACGDGSCTGRENVCNCPEDCGPHCTNWICEPGEDRASCPADCP